MVNRQSFVWLVAAIVVAAVVVLNAGEVRSDACLTQYECLEEGDFCDMSDDTCAYPLRCSNGVCEADNSGTPCTQHSDCWGEGVGCYSRVCQPVAYPNDMCSGGIVPPPFNISFGLLPCINGAMYCVAGMCLPLAPPRRCHSDFECEPGTQHCDFTRTGFCINLPGVGEPCGGLHPLWCQRGAHCDLSAGTQGTCQPSWSYADGQACHPQPEAWQPAELQCNPDAYCPATGVCTPGDMPDVSFPPCQDDKPLSCRCDPWTGTEVDVSGFYTGPVPCAPLLQQFDNCTNTYHCHVGAFEPGTCLFDMCFFEYISYQQCMCPYAWPRVGGCYVVEPWCDVNITWTNWTTTWTTYTLPLTTTTKPAPPQTNTTTTTTTTMTTTTTEAPTTTTTKAPTTTHTTTTKAPTTTHTTTKPPATTSTTTTTTTAAPTTSTTAAPTTTTTKTPRTTTTTAATTTTTTTEETTTTTTEEMTTTTTTTTTTTASEPSGLGAGAIVAIVLTSLVVLVPLVALGVYFYHKRKAHAATSYSALPVDELDQEPDQYDNE